MCDRVYLSWQSKVDHSWHVVGRLDRLSQAAYRFVYTRGAVAGKKFLPLLAMPDLYKVYEAKELFSIFSNRLLSKKRPEYESFIRWMNLDVSNVDELDVLARSEGRKVTDSFQVFPDLKVDEGNKLCIEFFVHGASHTLAPATIEEKLKPGERLWLFQDSQNEDPLAVGIRLEKPWAMVGYLPRYLAGTVHPVLSQAPQAVSARLVKISDDAPSYYRLLCSVTCDMSRVPEQSLRLSDEFIPLCGD